MDKATKGKKATRCGKRAASKGKKPTDRGNKDSSGGKKPTAKGKKAEQNFLNVNGNFFVAPSLPKNDIEMGMLVNSCAVMTQMKRYSRKNMKDSTTSCFVRNLNGS